MAKARGAIVVNTEKCKGCNLCVVACPTNVIELNDDVNARGFQYSYPARHHDCTGCVSCAMVCPDLVITVYRAKRVKKTA